MFQFYSIHSWILDYSSSFLELRINFYISYTNCTLFKSIRFLYQLYKLYTYQINTISASMVKTVKLVLKEYLLNKQIRPDVNFFV